MGKTKNTIKLNRKTKKILKRNFRKKLSTKKIRKYKKINNKTKKTRHKHIRSKKSRKNRGGMKENNIVNKNDSLEFFNYYLKKYEDSDQYHDVVKHITNIDNEIKGDNNILYVIDMQNDFVDRPLKIITNNATYIMDTELNGPLIPILNGTIGSFAVNNGSDVINKIIDFLNRNESKFSKIIFTRDFHDSRHCSFTIEGGPFPPHCSIGTYGSGLVGEIKNWITENSSDKVQVAFKGMHPKVDTFGAEKYSNDHYEKAQIGEKCCKNPQEKISQNKKMLSKIFASNNTMSCSDATGSYILNDDNLDPLNDLIFGANAYGEKVMKQMKSLDTNEFIQHGSNVYVCGLAGDYCVKDTAYNLKDKFPYANVNVIHSLTRNAFIPIKSPFSIPREDEDPSANNFKISKITDKNKHLSKYIFTYDGTYNLLSKDEMDNLHLNSINLNPQEPPTHWHFLHDPRDILELYSSNGVKLLV